VTPDEVLALLQLIARQQQQITHLENALAGAQQALTEAQKPPAPNAA
jgi:hypothetical protein